MEFGKKVDRRRYLEEKFDDLLEVIGSTYGNILKTELLSRLDVTINQFNNEMNKLFDTLKEKEVNRQSLLKNHTVESNKKKSDTTVLTDWEQKLKQIEESK
tara:strand:+ start:3627 stop:3929 length:303 start_codon:yes stop_codon:yes gene_type:complete